MNDRFQQAQRRLNLVKKHAHEIVGVKREQVAMVVEQFSRPGTYDITVHENGKVTVHQWTAPPPEAVVWASPDTGVDELAKELEPQEVPSPVEEFVPVVEAPEEKPEEKTTVTAEELKAVLGEAEDIPVAPEPPAPPTPAAPTRRRGRPKKA